VYDNPPIDTNLRAALLRLDLRLRLAVEALRDEMTVRATDPFRGLYVSEADVDTLLATDEPMDAARQLLGGEAGDVAPRVAHLAKVFELNAFEQEVLLICLAPELDLRYERLFAYLQDDVTRKRPTVDLIMRLLDGTIEGRLQIRQSLSPDGKLFRERLLALGDEAAGQWPLLSRPLRLDDRVASYLLGSDIRDLRVEHCTRLYAPPDAAAREDLPLPIETQLVHHLCLLPPAGPRQAVIYLQGMAAAGKVAIARTACSRAERTLLLVDADVLLTNAQATTLLALVVHEALLRDAVLAITDVGRLLSQQPEVLPVRTLLKRLVTDYRLTVILLGEQYWEPALLFDDTNAFRIEVPVPARLSALGAWTHELGAVLPAGVIHDMASRYRLDPTAIHAVARAAKSRADWRGEDQIRPDDVRAAARAVAAPDLAGLARRLETRYRWDDIVLPHDAGLQLRELSQRARNQSKVFEAWGFGQKLVRRSGITALFVGQPGTGKTMAAEVIANDLDLDLYRIDLSSVVSKYIGETEKNLERIFQAADLGDAVLLFDEADALFGKRSEVRDAHDRYANVEIAYLLQRLEAYEGMVILTTNMRGNIDEAFLRRLDSVLEFPFPEELERLKIWRQSFPLDAPVHTDVDLPFLARKFRLAGGHIRNIVVGAAYLAANDSDTIGMRHIARATRREYQKIGKLVADSDFEQYFSLLTDEKLRVPN